LLAITAMGAFALAIWLLQHPYFGIIHDATLYTLFALAKLHPDPLAGDVFLRFGSQDQFTIFAPLYATVIASMGLEHAAALLTFVSQGVLFACAWLFARQFMPALAATLGVALLAGAPGEYGPGDMFHVLEGFLTPRLPAEALVLGALLAALKQRYWTAGACVIVAMLMHPIMGAAGAALLILTFVAPVRPKLTLACAAVMLVATLVIVETSGSFGHMDSVWLFFVRITSGYLFVSTWSLNDWSRIAVPLAILAAGSLAGTGLHLRRICAGSLAMVACGLAITLLFCDALHVRIFMSMQAWRWLWLANVTAFVLSPVIAYDCWKRGDSGRIAVLLLATAWIFRGLTPCLYLLPVALACAAVPPTWSSHRYWRPALMGSCAVLALAVCLDLSDRFSYTPVGDATHAALPQQLRIVCSDGVIPAALIIAAWLALRRSKSVPGIAVIAAIAVLICGALVPLGWESWTYGFYTPSTADKFAQWRAEIPPRAEVLWPDTPIGAWYLLDRQSYWSPHQSAGAIFSREKALLVGHRTETITIAIEKSHSASEAKADLKRSPFGVLLGASRMGRDGMVAACTDPDLRYIVSWMPVAPTPFAPVIIDATKSNSRLYLYRCADLRP
jgi:hypothetical protein